MKKGRYQKPSKNPPWLKYLLPAGILVVAAAVICLAVLPRSTAESAEPAETTQPVEKLVNQIAIPGFEELVLTANQKEQELVLYNPAKNTCLFRISLYLEDGTLLWTSKEVKPGQDSDPIRLSQPLAAGTYPNAVLIYDTFTMDRSKTPLNGGKIVLTLRVKE